MSYTGLELSIVSNFYFDQKSADSLYEMLENYASYPPELMQKIQFVLVDDHSKIPITIRPDLPLNYQLFRIKNDITWNNGGARNLGVVKARTSKILMTDIDHFFPEKLLWKIVRHRSMNNTFYKFKRLDVNGKKMRSQPNILYLTKGLFFDALGYDEEFCGNYGSEDSFFLDIMKHRRNRLRYLSRWIKIEERKVDRQNAYHSFSRDINVNQDLRIEKRKIIKMKGTFAGHSRLFLNFQWEKVTEQMNAIPK
ncbi:MAG TPA: hypothetical protein VIQ51_06950 [Chryseosolibacter sp.]|jgi:hypothetical protein